MSRKTGITIGIPVYNEESNIAFLIQDLLHQKQENIYLEKIIIFSDGSTDKTVEEARKQGPSVEVIDSLNRQGIAYGLNYICHFSFSSILVLLNGDIRISDQFFLEKLAKPIFNQAADLTSCPILEKPATSFLEKILRTSMLFKQEIFDNYRLGHNVYTCHGPARAFSYNLYKEIKFLFSAGEDAYSYLYCLYHSFKYFYVKDTFVEYRLPDNFKDHQKQSLRFYQSKKMLEKVFGREFIKNEYSLPFSLKLQTFLSSFSRYPFDLSFYASISIFLKIRAFFVKEIPDVWEIAKSSKVLNQ